MGPSDEAPGNQVPRRRLRRPRSGRVEPSTRTGGLRLRPARRRPRRRDSRRGAGAQRPPRRPRLGRRRRVGVRDHHPFRGQAGVVYDDRRAVARPDRGHAPQDAAPRPDRSARRPAPSLVVHHRPVHPGRADRRLARDARRPSLAVVPDQRRARGGWPRLSLRDARSGRSQRLEPVPAQHPPAAAGPPPRRGGARARAADRAHRRPLHLLLLLRRRAGRRSAAAPADGRRLSLVTEERSRH